jgi:hypothetical protein
MWHQGRLTKVYPTSHTDAARGDLQFAMGWPRSKRHMLAELLVVHLETKLPGAQMGANWRGRRTPSFGPVYPEDRPAPDLDHLAAPIAV